MPKVRDAIRLVRQDGWYPARTRGSHRIFHHRTKKGSVTIAGHPSKDVHPTIWASILKQAGLSKGR